MSEIKALEKMKAALESCRRTEMGEIPFDTYWITVDACNAYLAEIEAEITGRFIELPVDEEGDVLRIGDELKCQDKSILLNSLSWDGRRWYATETVVSSGWYPVHLCRHVKPRTLEDVLQELEGLRGYGNSMHEYVVTRAAELANEIRTMFREVDR